MPLDCPAPLPRGVYVAPYLGPNGETVLLAITARQRLAAEPLFLVTADREAEMSDSLWRLLDQRDPRPTGAASRAEAA